MVIVGGGATGLGLALDATLRGLDVVLLEAEDFASGTSSRATKLIHGGVRYLAQGNIALVREALHERTTILRNAPHLAGRLGFIMPGFKCWQMPFYGAGLKAYDALAGRDGMGSTRFLSARQVKQALPGVQSHRLKGGVQYWDGQFDDARLALALARTAASQGALLVNYCPVDGLLHEEGRVAGVQCRDAETGVTYTVRAKVVVNAAGVWVDALRNMDADGQGQAATPMVRPSQGVHLVVSQRFMPGNQALLVPRTSDGRVLFAVPWLGKLILGTTDTPREGLPAEPRPFGHEVQFILSEAARYLDTAPTPEDVTSAWAGLRPLVNQPQGDSTSTGGLSREHTIRLSPSGLVTVTGGKWTTYRAMADDVLQRCVDWHLLPALPACTTARFPLIGTEGAEQRDLAQQPGLDAYGNEAGAVLALEQEDDVAIVPGLTPAMVRFAVRHEYARCVADVLGRRSRLLFLDAAAAERAASTVANLMQAEGIEQPRHSEFVALAQQYQTLCDASTTG